MQAVEESYFYRMWYICHKLWYYYHIMRYRLHKRG